MAAKKNKGIKGTAGSDNFVVRVFSDMPVVSDRKMQVQLEELNEEYAVLSMRQPRSSKRIKRLIPRDEFVAFSYNEDSGEVSFILPSARQEVMTVIGTIECLGGMVYVTSEDGTVHFFHEEDVEIVAEADDSGKKSKKDKKAKGKKGKKAAPVEDDEDDEDEDDSDEDDSEDDSDDEDESDEDESDEDEDDEDEDDEDSDDEDESDDDSDDEDSDDEDEDDEDSDDEDEDDEDEDDEDEDDEDEAPRGKKGKGKGRGRK